MRLLNPLISMMLVIGLAACAASTPVQQSASTASQHLKAAAISAAAYNQNPQTRLTLLSEQQLSEVKYVGLRETAAKNLTTEYLIAKQGNTLYIGFTGSNAKNDWMRNLHVQYKPYQGMPYPVHQGFVLAWKEVKQEITALIQQQKPANLVLSGHSKGGAVAGVAALDLLKQGYNVTEVTTFGAPPIVKIPRNEDAATVNQKKANSRLASTLNRISTHYVREYDYIQLASTGLAMNKQGIGKRLSLKDDGSLYSDTNRFGAALGLVTNTAAAKVEKFDSKNLNHHATTYLEALKKAK